MNNSTYKNANTCFITKKIASIGQRVYNVFTNITYAKANRRDDEVAFLMQPIRSFEADTNADEENLVTI